MRLALADNPTQPSTFQIHTLNKEEKDKRRLSNDKMV